MTREEAIEKVRQMSLPKETREILEALAPELRESEDERIRRILIESFEKANCSKVDEFTDCKLNKADVLAYLKKHKYDRMKPIYDARESFESALGKAWKDYNDSGARTVDGCEDDYVECAHAKGFREGYLFGLEKQKEYVSEKFDDVWASEDCEELIAEGKKLSPRFEKLLKDVCHAWYDKGIELGKKQKEQKPKIIIPKFRIGEYIKPKPYNEKHLIKNINENGYVLDVDFVIPFKDEDVWEVVEQKPAEWSEEDETALGDLMWCIEQARKSAKDENDMGNIWFAENWVKNRLKSLRPQPKVEWSEEEYGRLFDIEHYLDGTLQLNPDRKIACIDFLKSLRPVKQEWDTHDKAIVNCIVCCLDGQFVPEAARKQALKWFNKHRRDFLNSPSWKPSEDEERLINTSISFLKDFADKGYENAVECIDFLKSKLNGNSGK